jgi:hypothetical protein
VPFPVLSVQLARARLGIVPLVMRRWPVSDWRLRLVLATYWRAETLPVVAGLWPCDASALSPTFRLISLTRQRSGYASSVSRGASLEVFVGHLADGVGQLREDLSSVQGPVTAAPGSYGCRLT